MTGTRGQPSPLPLEEIGPYRVLRPIARGGMAEVFEVEERSSGEHFALKLLTQTGGALPRFNREYEAMIRLNHPNIVRVYSYGVHGALPWLSMELVEGTPIQAYAKRCGKPGTEVRTQEVVRVAHDLALALDHIHQRGLIHRDLKSANVLVLPDGRVKLLDFGTARVSDPVQDITRDGEFIGTFAYASPEQLLNDGVDGRADLYSFGVLLFRLATGKRPFDSSDLRELAQMQVHQAPPDPRSFVPQLPIGLQQIILALLEKSPDARPQSGIEVAQALETVHGAPLYLPGSLDVDVGSERMVGREAQIRELWRFLDGGGSAAGEGPGAEPGAMVLVVGLHGSGRHQVMKALEGEVASRGWRAINLFFRLGAEDVDQFEAMLTQVGRTFEGAIEGDLRNALKALERTTKDTSLTVAERLENLHAIGAALLAARADQDQSPVVVLVRGLQHAGGTGYESIVGLRSLLLHVEAPVLLIGDCTENADDPKSLARERIGDAARVTLPPMSVREVALLVGALLHRRPPPTAVARQIHRASGGLPTYVEEVVKGLVTNGIIQVGSRDQNRIEWAQREGWRIDVPEGARERVIDQLAGLPADRRRILEALALGGSQGNANALAGALQCRPAELLPALEDLSFRGWITLTRRDGIPYATWRQTLAESVVLGQLNPCRRRILERLLIAELADEPAFVAQIRLLCLVGEHGQAAQRTLDWAIHHLAKHRPSTALEALDIVVPKLEGLDLDDLLGAQLYLVYASCLAVARPMDPQIGRSLARAEASFAGASITVRERHESEAEVLLTRAQIQRIIGHHPNFRRQLMDAWELVEQAHATPLATRVATLLGWSNRMAGYIDDAATWHGRSRRLALEVGDRAVKAHADAGVAAWQLAHGLLTESEQTAAEAMQVFAEVGDLGGLAEAVPVYTHVLRLQGRFSEALALLEDQIPAMREGEVPTFYVRLLLANAWCEVDLGRLGRAQEWVDELGATLRKGEHLDLRLEADLVWGRILVASGLFDDALMRLRRVREPATAAGLTVLAEAARALEAEALWALGEQLTAIQAFRDAIGVLKETGDLPALVAACISQARAMSESVDPNLVFRPIDSWLETQSSATARIERQIARGRYLRAMGRPSDHAFDRAEGLVEAIASGLNPTDAAALRLHPWTRHIRRARRM